MKALAEMNTAELARLSGPAREPEGPFAINGSVTGELEIVEGWHVVREHLRRARRNYPTETWNAIRPKGYKPPKQNRHEEAERETEA